VCATALIKPKLLTWTQLIASLTANPANIIGCRAGTLTAGAPADLAIIDPAKPWTVDPLKFISKGRHSPFVGQQLTATVMHTIRRGVEAAA
jgi:dihydroorotase